MENVFDVLRSGIDSSMMGLGAASLKDLTPERLLIPEDFIVSVGD